MAKAVPSLRVARPTSLLARGSRWTRIALVLGIAGTIARPSAPVTGAAVRYGLGDGGVAGGRIYLPRLDRAFEPPGAETLVDVPCDVAGDACLPLGWQVRCGGMGRVRDLVVVRSDEGAAHAGAPTFSAVLAVGDGAALGVPSGDGIDWRVATGVDLGGLYHATVANDLGGWAVGDGARIARLGDDRGACWSIAASGWVTATLRSIELKPGGVPPIGDPWPKDIGGWAVGGTVTVTDGVTRTAAMIAQLDVSADPPLWRHLTEDTEGRLALPPLFDVQSVPTGSGGQELWAIGQDGPSGVLARMEEIDGQWTWRRDANAVLNGYPTELALQSEKQGWAFGRSAAAHPTAAVWRFEGGQWRSQPQLLHPGQSLIDAYSLDLSTIAYGLTPAPDDTGAARDVIRHTDGDREWATIARWPAGAPVPSGSGHHSLAPLGAERYLYALGDGLWLVDAGGGTGAEGAEWTRLWQRHDVYDVAGVPDHGWALADVAAPDGPHLIKLDRTGMRRWRPARPLPRLRALAHSGRTYWAVGDGGATWWMPAGATTWRPAPADGTTAGGHLLAVAATPGGAVWAAGMDPSGGGRVWRMIEGRWHVIEAPASRTPLTAIAATDGGNAWAGGDGSSPTGAVLFIRPAPADDGPCPSANPVDDPWQRAGDVCFAMKPSRVGGMAALGDDILWLARERDIVRTGGGGLRVHDDLGVRGPDGDCPTTSASAPCKLRFECRLTAISAAAANAVWAAVRCPSPHDDPGRGATRLLRWDGTAWHQGPVVNTRIRRLAAGADEVGTPWVLAVGDWTTVLQFPTR